MLIAWVARLVGLANQGRLVRPPEAGGRLLFIDHRDVVLPENVVERLGENRLHG